MEDFVIDIEETHNQDILLVVEAPGVTVEDQSVDLLLDPDANGFQLIIQPAYEIILSAGDSPPGTIGPMGPAGGMGVPELAATKAAISARTDARMITVTADESAGGGKTTYFFNGTDLIGPYITP